MEIGELLTPGHVVAGLKASSKKHLVQQLAALAAPAAGADERTIFDTVCARERLGSTGLGGGIAYPHGRLPSLAHPFAVFARLAHPVEFEAIDARPVDLAVLLLSPVGHGALHLKALARLSRTFRDPALVEKLRGSTSADALYAMLVGVGTGAVTSRAA